MSQKREFSRTKSIGARDSVEIATYLRLLKDHDGANALLAAGAEGAGLSLPGYKPAWMDTGVLVGYLVPGDLTGTVTPISATLIKADESLIDSRIKISLDRFYVHKYPGFGQHHILCEYRGRNQAKAATSKKPGAEEMRFATNVFANDGAGAGVLGQPLFVGVAVGKDGLAFEGRTVNVKSKSDEKILRALNNPAVKTGLSLLTTAQPALKPFVGLTGALVNATIGKENVQVHEFMLGLDFGDNTSSIKLRCGSYIVVQSDAAHWHWDDYVWSGQQNLLLHKESGNRAEANYSVLGISAYTES